MFVASLLNVGVAMRILLTLVTVLLFAASASAQSANNLMDRFAAAWTQDDAELVNSMMHDEVVLVGDGNVIEGFDAVNEWRARQMEATDRLTITTVKLDRYEDVAYHTGRWALSHPHGTFSGDHTFVFERGEDDTWKIKSMAINGDPQPRATAGDPVWVVINRVEADKREQFETWLQDFWGVLEANVAEGTARPGDREALEHTRVLRPTRANEDGTYTYVFLMDPVFEEADYDIPTLLRHGLSEEEAQEMIDRFDDTVESRDFYPLEQMRR